MKKVKKALIPAAGLGTRFLPATKTVPKEMLPIVDTPIIFHVIEEAVDAGIEDIVLIAGRGKTAIEDFFDISYELEDKLSLQGKSNYLQKLNNLREKVNIISIRQKEALGLGHAVYCGRPIIGDEPFAVLLGDEMTSLQEGNVTADLVRSFSDTGLSTVAVMEVEPQDVEKYGIVAFAGEPTSVAIDKNTHVQRYKVTDILEKPNLQKAPSRLALSGRYVFDPKVFSYLEKTQPGKNGEIQLTDAMVELSRDPGLSAQTFCSQRYDAGDKLGYLKANIEFALQRQELSSSLKDYLLNLAQKIKGEK